MKLRTLFLTAMLSLAVIPSATAAQDDQPSSLDELKSYEFVVDGDGYEHTMRIKDKKFGPIGDRNSGYIKYRLVEWKGKEIVQIDMIKGVKGLRGVGKLLKKEVLDRHPSRAIVSDLVSVNRTKLLKAWAKGFPHSSSDKNGKLFRKAVPAMAFKGFVYTISPKVASNGIGGRIEMKMVPARQGRNGKIIIDDPIALDKILATTEPEFIHKKHRPKSAKELKEEARENERAAKQAGDTIEKLAKKVAKKEGVDEDDLRDFLWDVMNDECGRDRRDGSAWAEQCLFTRKGSGYVVKSEKSRSSFYLDKLIEDEAEDWVEDNT